MAEFRVRQRLIYYEDFTVEADSAEDAINLVNAGDVDGEGPEYLSAEATYITDGIYALKVQPENAVLPVY